MANLPGASTTVSEITGVQAAGIDLVCVISPVATNADTIPRQYGNSDAIYAKHGYSEGLEYCHEHFTRTGLPVLFVGIPIVTAGVIGRENKSGNTGSSVTTVTAGGSGVLAEHSGKVRVITGGTIGTDQILLGISMNGGRTEKVVRLGTASSYTIPYFGVSIAFAAGTLVAGDVIHTWFGTAPLGDSAGWTLARQRLAAQQKAFRTILFIGDVSSSVDAAAINSQLEAYKTSNERFTLGRVSLRDRLPYASLSQTRARMTGNPSLTFAEVGATGDTITRSAGSWITDGFVAGDWITITGSASNNVSGTIASLTATVITLGTLDLAAEGPVANVTVTATPTLTFAEVGATGDTITRSRGSWLDDGFRVGDKLVITGTASNNITCVAGLTAVTATALTLNTDDLAAEVLGSFGVSITAGELKASWMASLDSTFASIDAAPHISLGAGRAFTSANGYAGYPMRRPAHWFASWRQYQHDLHITAWRKDDGPVDADLFDTDQNLVEWDDRADGKAASAARFTSLRTWANGPQGGFVANDLTRAGDASLRSAVSSMTVVNLACSLNQAATENAAVGQTLVLNEDGTATTDSLSTVQKRVNDTLELGLLTDQKGEGQRASRAVWTPDPADLYNVPEPIMNGTLELLLNGIVHTVRTAVKLQSAA